MSILPPVRFGRVPLATQPFVRSAGGGLICRDALRPDETRRFRIAQVRVKRRPLSGPAPEPHAAFGEYGEEPPFEAAELCGISKFMKT
jgi:hypothetical protein